MRKLILILTLIPHMSLAQTTIDLEAGQVDNAFNKIKIPGDSGTNFNLGASQGTSFYHRLSLIHDFKSGSVGVRLLYAPLRLTGDKTYSKNIQFQGANFNAGSETETTFQFNSYRASYYYRLRDDKKWKLRIGGTAKVRDAEIKLAQGNTTKRKANIGVVPLLYFYGEYLLSEKWKLIFDFDGLASTQGRAIDIALMAGYQISPSWELRAGARMLEGGADNENVYNFSQLNYAFGVVRFTF